MTQASSSPHPTAPPEKTGAAGWKVALGPALAALLLWVSPGDDPMIARMAAIAVWMAAWWITEAVPIPVTSLLPIVLMPVLGVMSVHEVAPNYGRSTVFLFLGGFLLALGLEASGAHRRLALWIVHVVGGEPRRLVLGFMIATAVLSMWISNTATVMVMMPIGLAVLSSAADRGVGKKEIASLGVAVMLGIAYSADIGGMTTLVGTPPNLSYKEQLIRLFPNAPEPSFIEWMMLALPATMTFLIVGWLVLTRIVFRLPSTSLLGDSDAITDLRRKLGPIGRDEIVAATVFASAAILWMTRTGLSIGDTQVPGWSSLFETRFVDDAVVAIFLATLLFVLPSKSRPGQTLMTWPMTSRVPWGMLLLFGGGFALAAGFKSSGLSNYVGQGFQGLEGYPPLLIIVTVCFGLTFLTELTSNTATTELVLPILAAAGVTLSIDPRALMIPATLSASCAFMMPVASPTQAVVFGSGYVPIKDMVRAGIWFNLIGVVLLTTAFALLAGPIMGIDFTALPEWATTP